jgi:acetyl-CoA synthetase
MGLEPDARRLLTRPRRDAGSWDRLRAEFAWDIPDAVNIAHLCCDSWAVVAPDRVAVRHLGPDGARTDWTYGDLKHASDKLAAAFASRGVMRGDRVAVLMAQHPAVLVAHFAALKLGAISAAALHALRRGRAGLPAARQRREAAIVTERPSLDRGASRSGR